MQRMFAPQAYWRVPHLKVKICMKLLREIHQGIFLVPLTGLEPATSAETRRRPNQLDNRGNLLTSSSYMHEKIFN